MINTRKLNYNQYKLVLELLAHFKQAKTEDADVRARWDRNIFTRKELRDAHGVLRERRASPYFISKNLACKCHVKGMPYGSYDLTALLKHAEKHPPQAPAPKEQPVAKTTGKRETKQVRKGAKKAAGTPAEAVAS